MCVCVRFPRQLNNSEKQLKKFFGGFLFFCGVNCFSRLQMFFQTIFYNQINHDKNVEDIDGDRDMERERLGRNGRARKEFGRFAVSSIAQPLCLGVVASPCAFVGRTLCGSKVLPFRFLFDYFESINIFGVV